MLENVSEAIKDCFQHAEYCRRRAAELVDPAAKQTFLDMEQRWLDLASSYQFSERLSRFCNVADATRSRDS